MTMKAHDLHKQSEILVCHAKAARKAAEDARERSVVSRTRARAACDSAREKRSHVKAARQRLDDRQS